VCGTDRHSLFNTAGTIMHNKALWKLNGLFIILITSACGYSVSVNERIVYSPAPLFDGYNIVDQHLANCVLQTITDLKVTKVSDLKRLNCSNAGIKSLAGLEVFTGLEELNLAQNSVQSLSELAKLSQLKILILNGNALKNAAPLLALLQLQTLDLSDNDQLICADLQQLEKNWADLDTTLIKPQQCR
jgi:hypothetical protein